MEQHNKSPFTGWLGRLVARVFRRKTLWSLSLAAAGALSVAAYAMLATVSGSIRIAPVAITVNSDSSLPPEVRALEAQTAPLLFDRDTKSEHVAYAAHSIDLKLERLGEIQAIKVYGPAPYELSVQAQQGGAWNTIGGLDKLKLDRLSAAWSQFNASRSVSTGALRLLITPVNGNPGNAGGKGGNNNAGSTVATGLPEIEIWAAGEHALLRGEALVKAWPRELGASAGSTGSAMPPQTRAYAASPATAVVGQDGQTLRFTLDRPAQRFKRAWLSYEAYGLAHWVSPVRRVNGQTSQGGSYTFSGNGWSALAEPIHPDWLRQGDNRIDFSLPPQTAGSYSVRNVRVIAELDDGHNFIARATTAVNGSGANAVNTVEADTAALIDGDLATGWSPYRDPRGKSGQPELILYFDKPTQLDSLNLNLVNALGGTVSLDLLVGGLWQNAGLSAINGAKLGAGWNQLSGFAAVPAQALRITFQNGTGSPAEIREITATGSGVGSAHAAAIAVAYPDAGQFYGRSAYLRGYLSLPDNGSGPATLSLSVPAATSAGTATGTPSLRPVSLGADGSFGLLVSKDEVGYARQTDAEPWQVQLVAQYPNGQQLTQTVLLTQGLDAAKARGQLPAGPNAGAAIVLAADEAGLDIDPEAVTGEEKIRITPLSEAQLPRLDPGMTNVTKGPRKGYRFTPTPHKFKKAIRVTLPYDSALIPRGHTEADIKTYYFDKQAGRWVALDRAQLDTAKKRVTSLTDHFTDMINATLTVPDHPQTVSFNPTSLKDIKAADPGAGINLIEPPKANNMGDARLGYPIEIPPGRAGMQPQLAIQYNSGGSNGWLGQGWDLSVPSIGIETRWGVPRYDSAKESETYVLNGEQLVPLGADGKPGVMPHRSAWDALEARTAGVKRFVARVEGQFRRIIRRGSAPTNYWWEVTDKNGTQHFYGGQDADDASGKLGRTQAPNPGVYRWMLRKSVDTHGNSVVYQYDQVCDTGMGATGACGTSGYVDGKQIYLQRIDYTGHPDLAAPYSVVFHRDPHRRSDVSIDARGGFKQVTAQRLKTITVKYHEQTVRSYELVYNQNAYGSGGTDTAFGKTLLTAVVQKGANGVEFNRHAFEYHNEVAGSDGKMDLFKSKREHVDAQKDELAPGAIPPLLSGLFSYPQTLVGGGLGANAGFSGFFGIGMPLIGENVHVAVTASGNTSFSQSNLSLIDIDGDGLPDKVFERDGKVYYRKNTSNIATGEISFKGGQPDALAGISQLGDSQSLTWGMGVKGKAFAATAYAKDNHTTTTDKVYFADVNGDGLVDQVNNRTVNFNRRSADGQYAFNAQSAGTQMPIRAGTINAAQLLSAMAAERAAMEAGNPRMDAVRRWVAPYDGRISVTGEVSLHNFRTDASLAPGEKERRLRYETADGVRVSIQHGDTEIWAADIGAEDYATKSPAQTYLESAPALTQGRAVRKGEAIYFRVHSRYDGNYDRVHWAPRVEYVDGAGQPLAQLDANQRNAYQYRADADFVLAGRGVRMVAPNYGTVKVQGQLQKTGITSDDVTLVVELSEGINDGKNSQGRDQTRRVVISEQGFTQTLKWNETGSINLDHPMEVAKGQSIVIRIASDSPIDLSKLKWLGEGSPKLYYTYAYEPEVQVKQPAKDPNQTETSQLPTSADAMDPEKIPMPTDGGVMPRRDIPVVNARGEPSILIQAAYDADIYSVSTEGAGPQAPWVAPRDGVILISPWVKLQTYQEPLGCTATEAGCTDVVRAPDGQIAFTVKRNGELLAKQIIQVRNKALVAGTQGYAAVQAIAVKAGDKLFIDFSARDPLLADEILSTDAYLAYGSASTWQAPLSDSVHLRALLQAQVSEQGADGSASAPGTVLLVARRGAQIVERKEFTVQSLLQLEHQFTRAVQAGEGYAFDFLTIDPRISVSRHEVWATYTGVAAWSAPKAGTVAVKPQFSFSRPATGAITLHVIQNGQSDPAHSRSYTVTDGVLAAGQAPLALTVAARDSLRFEYVIQDHALSSALADKGAVAISYAQPTNWSVPADAGSGNVALSVQPRLSLAPGAASASLNGSVTLRVWRGAQLLADTPLTVADGQVTSSVSLPLSLAVNSGDVLGFEYVSATQELLDAVSRHDVELRLGGNSATVTVALNPAGVVHGSQALTIRMPEAFQLHPKEGSVRHRAAFDALYGNPYRGWSYIGYNSDHRDVGAPASKPLVNTQLRMRTEAEIKDPNSEHPAYIAAPAAKTQRWESLDDNWWIGADQITSSRRGVDQIDVPDAASFAASGNVLRVPRRSAGNTFSAGGGMYLTVNFSNGRSSGELDLVDLNGDRFPDIIGGGKVQYTEPGGTMAETLAVLGATNTTVSDGLSFAIGPSPRESAETAKGITSDTGIRKPLNPEKGAVPFSAGIDTGNSKAQGQLADINGDGLPDQLIQTTEGLKVRLNLGYGFADAEPWGGAAINRSETVGLSFEAISYTSNDGKEQLTDINGDGLPDRVVAGGTGELAVSFNTGNGFGPERTITRFVTKVAFLPGDLGKGLGLPPEHTTLYDGASLSYGTGAEFTYAYTIWAGPVPVIDLVFGGGVNVGATMTQPTIGLRDMDGDGLVDGVFSLGSDKAEVAVNATGKTNLLKTIRRPLGAVIQLDYARSGNTYAQPHSKWVMSELRVFDGVADDTPTAWKAKGSDWQRMSFAYAGGQYDRYERDFLGYASVSSRQHDTAGLLEAGLTGAPVYRRSEQEYANTQVYNKGLLLNETLIDAASGHTLSRSVHQYDYWRLGDATGSSVNPANLQQFPVQGEDGQPAPQNSRATAVLFPRLIRADKFFYEHGASEQSSYTVQGYDSLGNVSSFEEGGSEVEPVQALIGYSVSDSSCAARHIVGLPDSIIVTTASGQQVRRREGHVNCATKGGKLDWQRAHIKGADYAQTSFGWDRYGNLEHLEGPANHRGETLDLHYVYDDATQTWPKTISNQSYGLSSSAEYEPRWGKPLLTTDANGNTMAYGYDDFGRTTQVLGPQEQAAGQPWTIRFSYSPCLDLQAANCISSAKTEHADRRVNNTGGASGQASYQSNPIETLLFADGLKRVLQTKKDARVAAAAGSAPQDSMIASGRVAFDALGRTVAQYYPTVAPKGQGDAAFVPTPDDSARPTVTDYDAQDRPTRTELPDKNVTTMAYGFGTDGFSKPRLKTEVTDALGNKKQSLRDVRGLITTVVEENRAFDKTGQPSGAKAPVATRYVYDPLKQITQVIDAAGNTTTVEYDGLGRRTVISNPDTGRVETVFDAASNPIRKTTARLAAQAAKTGSLPYVQYDYDHNRLLSIHYPQYPDANVTYVYGTNSDKVKNQAGRIKQVSHQSGTEVREYGSLGEVVKETLTLTAAANGGSTPPVYTTQYDFDSFGRLHQLTLPDGELITNEFDSGGNLMAIRGRLNGTPYEYLKRLDYDRFESRLYLVAGNGIATSYSYDPANRRLARLQSGLSRTPGEVAGSLQDLAYGYDSVGNILSLNDSAPIPKSNEFGGQSTQNFHYDDLYRLIKANGVYTTAREVQNYDFAMQYDAIHNITHKYQQHTVAKTGGSPRIETATSYDWAYAYRQRSHTQPHAPTRIGNRTFDYDENGNQAGWQNLDNGTRRVIVWDEDNKVREVQDPKHGAAFSYDDKGERKLKKSQYGETAYINQFFTVRNGAIASTHVYAGTSRIVTKLGAGTPVGKVTPGDLKGTNNLSPANASLTEYVAPDGSTTTTATATATTTLNKGQGQANKPTGTLAPLGRGQGEGQANPASMGNFPGQGMAHRSERANEVARNSEKNKHLNGGDPGGEQGAVNSNAGGNSSNAGGNGGGNAYAWGRSEQGRGNSGGNAGGHPDPAGAGQGAGVGSGGGAGNGAGNTSGTGGGTAGSGEGREFIYFYHPDHLGSTAYVTDEKAQRYEHLAYFPFGETWVQESTATWRVPYQYTAKEMDSETGLYYFGARYFDPRTSVWQSPDPIDRFGPHSPAIGLNLYQYGLLNPIKYIDLYGFDETEAESKRQVIREALRPPETGGGEAPVVTMGKAYAAVALFTVGKLTGDDAAANTAMEVLQENRQANTEVFALIASAGRGGAKSGAQPPAAPRGRVPGPAIDRATNHEIGRIVVDSKGNAMIEPLGGRTVPAGKGGVDTHTLYPNGSNYQRLNPQGHGNNSTPHGHGHLPGTGPGIKGQGPSIDPQGNQVPWNSPAAHWPIK